MEASLIGSARREEAGEADCYQRDRDDHEAGYWAQNAYHYC